jgi:uncharacterized repeat protein (TIGR03837 family)
VSWRLARALSAAGMSVRLWINDLVRLKRLRPTLNDSLAEQMLDGFTVLAWTDQAEVNYQPADLVIEAFGCRLSESMLTRMVLAETAPVWINLEYLSAESWAVHSHGLPSPHPRLPLTQYFFFPGFVPESGGLLREDGLLQARSAFTSAQRAAFLKKLGVDALSDRRLVSLFCYEQAPIEALLLSMRSGPPTLCLIPEGVAGNALTSLMGADLSAGRQVSVGQLTLRIIPFLEPDDYDRLLWSCDVNFVRGEDSLVRAHWAQQPLVWQLYPQHDDAHLIKLAAFLDQYCLGMSEPDAQVVRAFWQAWNGKQGEVFDWAALVKLLPTLALHQRQWSAKVASVDELSAQLIRFASKIG